MIKALSLGRSNIDRLSYVTMSGCPTAIFGLLCGGAMVGPSVFHRRFRMCHDLFMHDYNQAVGLRGVSDTFNEYLHIADMTGRECLKYFLKGVIETFDATYLRSLTPADCQYLFDLHGRVHCFPGILGSLECMNRQQKNRLTAWRGQFTTRFKGTHPTII